MKTRFFALAALALALVACNNDNENLNGDPVAAQFTANIAPATRASGTTWTAGDRIGITDIGNDSQYGNVPFILKNGKFEAEGKLTKASSLPSLSLYASNTLARPVSRTLADMYNNNWNIGLSLSYPLSSLYKNNHKIKESKWMVSLHKNEEEQKKQKIRMEVRTAFLRHKEALQEVEALKLSVRQAQENYRIMQNRYLNQLAILTDLLDANSVLLNAELQLTNTRTHVIYTYYQLQKACGRL